MSYMPKRSKGPKLPISIKYIHLKTSQVRKNRFNQLAGLFVQEKFPGFPLEDTFQEFSPTQNLKALTATGKMALILLCDCSATRNTHMYPCFAV